MKYYSILFIDFRNPYLILLYPELKENGRLLLNTFLVQRPKTNHRDRILCLFDYLNGYKSLFLELTPNIVEVSFSNNQAQVNLGERYGIS